MLKNIVKGLEPSSTLKINEVCRGLEKKGETVFKFGFGQSPFQIPSSIVDALRDNAYQNRYLPMQGLEELREAIAKYTSAKKNYNYKSENVVIGPGSKELMFLLHILFDGEIICLLYTSPSPRDSWASRMPSSAWKKKTTTHQFDSNISK